MSDSEPSSGKERPPSEQARRRGETEEERLDRNLAELMQELRVALPGIQVLLAFLLIVPFQERWPELTDFERVVYYVTLLLAAGSSVCLIAPTARHRLRFRALDKRWVVAGSNRLAVTGLALLGGAICGMLLLITSFLYSGALAAAVTAIFALAIGWLWFAAPARRGVRHDQ